MPLIAYHPQDPRNLVPDPRRQEFSPDLAPGDYVYVLDCNGVVWVAPDGSHQHPRVIGRARPVAGAGELQVGVAGEVLLLNNESGTFQCHRDSLPTVVGSLIRQGGKINWNVVTMSHWD